MAGAERKRAPRLVTGERAEDEGRGATASCRVTDRRTMHDTLPVLENRRTTAKIVGVSLRKLDDLRASGEFPVPIHVGGMLRWRRDELLAYIESRPRFDPMAPRPERVRRASSSRKTTPPAGDAR